MPSSSLSNRSSSGGGVPSTGMHQHSGSLSAGWLTSNNLPGSLSQLSPGGLHTSLVNRGGMNVASGHSLGNNMNGVVGASLVGTSPASGAMNSRVAIPGLGMPPSLIGSSGGPRIPNSSGNIGGGSSLGSGIGRTINMGNTPSINTSSRANYGMNNGNGGLNMQGPGRPLNSILQSASPQMVSLLGNNFSTNVGSTNPGQGQAAPANGQLSSFGLSSDGNTNEGTAFDLSDFPQLSSRPGSAGSSHGSLATLRKQGVNSIVQQSQEFSIQNEDFPALPGFKGGVGTDFSSEAQQKEQQHENAIALLQSPHFMMGRSSGFAMGGGTYVHRQPQLQSQAAISGSSVSGPFAPASTSDLLHLQGAVSDMFQSSHGLSAPYLSQVQSVGPPGGGNPQIVLPSMRTGAGGGSSSNPSALSSYDQLLRQYQNQQSHTHLRLGTHHQQPLSALGQTSRELKLLSGIQTSADPFGLLGLLSVIRMSHPDLTTLALGTDLTALGLNLNSRENLYKTFASPWAEGPIKGEPEYTLPQCYLQESPKLEPGYFGKFKQNTLFYIFYSMPGDEAQLYAANELYKRGWFYHKDLRMWLTRIENLEPLVKTDAYERSSYIFFDHNNWEIGRKDNLVLQYEMVEKIAQP